MKAYFDSIEKEVPEQLQQVFLNRRDTAVITIDMHDGHLSTDPDCPCPSPRGREIIEPLNHFMNEARTLGLPIIHVRSTLRKGAAQTKNCFRLRGAWCFRLRSVRFPTSQSTPSKAHAGTECPSMYTTRTIW